MRIDKAVMTLKNYTESKERSPSSAVRKLLKIMCVRVN